MYSLVYVTDYLGMSAMSLSIEAVYLRVLISRHEPLSHEAITRMPEESAITRKIANLTDAHYRSTNSLPSEKANTFCELFNTFCELSIGNTHWNPRVCIHRA